MIIKHLTRQDLPEGKTDNATINRNIEPFLFMSGRIGFKLIRLHLYTNVYARVKNIIKTVIRAVHAAHKMNKHRKEN